MNRRNAYLIGVGVSLLALLMTAHPIALLTMLAFSAAYGIRIGKKLTGDLEPAEV